MTGPTRLLLDTNAVIALLADTAAMQSLMASAEWVGISVLTAIEYRASPRLNDADEALFAAFLSRIEVIDLLKSDRMLLGKVVAIRRQKSLKLPDALIAATALSRGATLVTRDVAFERVEGLALLSF